MERDGTEGRQEYLAALERRIEDWTARVEALEARAADADPVAKAEIEEVIDELWTRLEAARDDCARITTSADQDWPRGKTALELAWSDVEDAYGDLYRTLARR